MIFTLARFELVRRLRTPQTLAYAALLFLVAFLGMNVMAGAFDSIAGSSGQGKPFANSPYTLHFLVCMVSYFGVTTTSAITGEALHQDFEHRLYGILLSTRVGTRRYLVGRWLGALLVSLVLFALIPLGAFVATKMPWLKAERLGVNHFASYAMPYLVGAVPLVLMACSLFFGVVAWARVLGPVQVAGVTLLLGYLVALRVTDGVHDRTLASLLDPFGLLSASHATEYWNTAQRNKTLVVPHGVYLANRILWPVLGILAGIFGSTRFRPAEPQARRKVAVATPPTGRVRATPPHLDLSASHFVRHVPRLALISVRQLLAGPELRIILGTAVVLIAVTFHAAGEIFGTKTWPVTGQALAILQSNVTVLAISIATLGAADLVFRDRTNRLQQVMDSLPTPAALSFWVTLSAVAMLEVLLFFVAALTTIALQEIAGYHRLELGLYLTTLGGIVLPTALVYVVVALLCHVLSPNRNAGHIAFMLLFGSGMLLPQLGVEHHLLLVNSEPPWVYSDMNRFGPFAAPLFWFRLYWAAWAGLLVALGQRMWPRGDALTIRQRLRVARRAGVSWAALGVSAIIVLVAGVVVFNTNRLNKPIGDKALHALRADYERRYRPFADEPQPTITAIELRVDLFPRERRAEISGTYVLTNQATAPVTQIFVSGNDELKVHELALGRAATTTHDDKQDIDRMTLAEPLARGATCALTFASTYAPRGFRNDSEPTDLVENGTFLHDDVAPHIGYDPNIELHSEDLRAREKLGLPHDKPKPDSPAARLHNYVAHDAGLVDFTATISTDADQIAIAPGQLDRTWTEDGRRFFRYRAKQMLGFWAVVSGRYAVSRDASGPVAVEVDYHPAHPFDVEHMRDAAKKALAEFGTRFGAFPRKELRIVEFPRYADFAQSFASMIPYSEGVGFIARVDSKDDKDIDYPFYITAHEVAHQWWAHQLVPGRAEGETLLSESLAQYSALTLMKKELGEAEMSRFLSYELHHYLVGRATDAHGEKPLDHVDQQLYIHYNKGSLALYGLADLVGQEPIDRALRAMLAKFAGKGAPYPTSDDLLVALRAECPASAQQAITDLLQRIVLYDNRASRAEAHQRDDGKWETTVEVSFKKVAVDGKGDEITQPLDDTIATGVVDAAGHVLGLERRLVARTPLTATITTDEKPVRAGVDPLHELLDRTPDDNLMDVTMK